jgi:hypothetical protein
MRGEQKMAKKTKGKPTKTQMQKKNPALYNILKKRGLLEKVCPKPNPRFAAMSDGQLVAKARKCMKVDGIETLSELKRVDEKLSTALIKRKLVDQVGFKRKFMRWDSMTDAQLVQIARKDLKG